MDQITEGMKILYLIIGMLLGIGAAVVFVFWAAWQKVKSYFK